jgi:hypothetical protein
MNTVRVAQVRVMPPATEASRLEVILLVDEVAA